MATRNAAALIISLLLALSADAAQSPFRMFRFGWSPTIA